MNFFLAIVGSFFFPYICMRTFNPCDFIPITDLQTLHPMSRFSDALSGLCYAAFSSLFSLLLPIKIRIRLHEDLVYVPAFLRFAAAPRYKQRGRDY